MLRRLRQVAAKIEVAEGTAEALAAADAKILPFDPKLDFDPQRTAQNPSGSSFSKRGEVTGKIPGTHTLGIQLRGSGTATTSPEWAKYLRACGFSESSLYSINIGAITSGPFQHGETITGGTSGAQGRVVIKTLTGTSLIYFIPVGTLTFQSGEVITGGTSGATATTSSTPTARGKEYKLISVLSSIPSLTQQLIADGMKKVIKGARGNIAFNFKTGEPVMMNYTFNGVKESIAAASFLTIVYETTKPPAFVSAALTVEDYAAKISEMSIDVGNKLSPDEDANAALGIKSFIISDRDPAGSFDPAMVVPATNDFYTHWLSDAEKILDFTIGSITGNKFRFYLPKIQYKKVADEEREGIDIGKIDFSLNLNKDAGDDELTILAL